MGAKAWVVAFIDGDARTILGAAPPLDRERARALVERLLPPGRWLWRSRSLQPLDDVRLSHLAPRGRRVHVGSWPGLELVASSKLGGDYPSRLPPRFLAAAEGRDVVLLAMHSVVDWFAYGLWIQGELVRSLSVSPDGGVKEDEGTPLSFETSFWSGARPAVPPGEEAGYPLVFHPLELGQVALRHFLGFTLEGPSEPTDLDPETIPLAAFRR